MIPWADAPVPVLAAVIYVDEHQLDYWPRWITQGPGGAGFVEVADRILKARSQL